MIFPRGFTVPVGFSIESPPLRNLINFSIALGKIRTQALKKKIVLENLGI